MALSKEFLIPGSETETLLFENGDILNLQITHSNPARVRNSTLNFDYAVIWPPSPVSTATPITKAPPESTGAESDSSGKSGAGAGAGKGPGSEELPILKYSAEALARGYKLTGAETLEIRTKALSTALESSLISNITPLQEQEVAYKRVEISTYRTDAPITLTKNESGLLKAGNDLGVQTSPKRNFKCGSGLTGARKASDKLNHRVISYNLYGSGLEDYQDKPGRILINGTPFENHSQLIDEPQASNLLEALGRDIQLNAGTVQVTLRPVVRIGKKYRKVVIVQLDGVRSVAGKGKGV